MSARRQWLGAGGALLLAAAVISCGPGAIEFTFAPPIGETYRLQEESTHRIEKSGEAPIEFKMTATSRLQFRRESAWRIQLEETIEEAELIPTQNPAIGNLGTEFAGHVVHVDFDDEGEAVAVEGQRALFSAMIRALQERGLVDDAKEPPPAPSGESELAIWNERVHTLAGRSLAPGESFESPASFDLGHGVAIEYRARMTLGAPAPCPGQTTRQCVTLRIEYLTSEEEATRYGGQDLAELSPDNVERGSHVVVDRVEVSGRGERTLEPASLLVFKEKLSPQVRISGTEDGRPFVLVVRHLSSFDLKPIL